MADHSDEVADTRYHKKPVARTEEAIFNFSLLQNRALNILHQMSQSTVYFRNNSHTLTTTKFLNHNIYTTLFRLREDSLEHLVDILRRHTMRVILPWCSINGSSLNHVMYRRDLIVCKYCSYKQMSRAISIVLMNFHLYAYIIIIIFSWVQLDNQF